MAPVDQEQVRLELRTFLSGLTGHPATFEDGEDLVARGLLKSMHIMDLVNHLEERWGVAVTQRDVFSGRLRSLDGLVGLLVAGGGR